MNDGHDVTVRRAAAADVRAVAEVYTASWKAGYAGHFPADYLDALDVARAEARFAESIGGGGDQVWAAVRAEEIVGVTRFGPCRDTDHADWGEVYIVYVHPAAWGTGAGRALLATARRELAARGYTHAQLWLLDGNERAERFYAADGWVHDGATKVDNRLGFAIPEVRLVRRLT